MKNIFGRIFMFLFLLGVWLLLTYPINKQELLVGGLVALVIVLISSSKKCLLSDMKFTPKSFIYLIGFIFFFLWELLRSNIDVAFRVIDPKLPINPGIVKVRTNLKSKLGRLVLANSITLTPGTLTVETDEEHFYIHWIDVQGKDIDESTNHIVQSFEKFLGVIFG